MPGIVEYVDIGVVGFYKTKQGRKNPLVAGFKFKESGLSRKNDDSRYFNCNRRGCKVRLILKGDEGNAKVDIVLKFLCC